MWPPAGGSEISIHLDLGHFAVDELHHPSVTFLQVVPRLLKALFIRIVYFFLIWLSAAHQHHLIGHSFDHSL